MNSIVRMLAVYAGLSLLLCGFTHLEWSPLQPNGFGQWFALFLLIFPAAAAAEFLGERLLGRRAPVVALEMKTHADCPWSRVAMSVLVVVVTIGVGDGRGVVAVAPCGRGLMLQARKLAFSSGYSALKRA